MSEIKTGTPLLMNYSGGEAKWAHPSTMMVTMDGKVREVHPDSMLCRCENVATSRALSPSTGEELDLSKIVPQKDKPRTNLLCFIVSVSDFHIRENRNYVTAIKCLPFSLPDFLKEWYGGEPVVGDVRMETSCYRSEADCSYKGRFFIKNTSATPEEAEKVLRKMLNMSGMVEIFIDKVDLVTARL